MSSSPATSRPSTTPPTGRATGAHAARTKSASCVQRKQTNDRIGATSEYSHSHWAERMIEAFVRLIVRQSKAAMQGRTGLEARARGKGADNRNQGTHDRHMVLIFTIRALNIGTDFHNKGTESLNRGHRRRSGAEDCACMLPVTACSAAVGGRQGAPTRSPGPSIGSVCSRLQRANGRRRGRSCTCAGLTESRLAARTTRFQSAFPRRRVQLSTADDT